MTLLSCSADCTAMLWVLLARVSPAFPDVLTCVARGRGRLQRADDDGLGLAAAEVLVIAGRGQAAQQGAQLCAPGGAALIDGGPAGVGGPPIPLGGWRVGEVAVGLWELQTHRGQAWRTVCLVCCSHLQAGMCPMHGLGEWVAHGLWELQAQKSRLPGTEAPLSGRWVVDQTASCMQALAPLSCVAGRSQEVAVSLCVLQEATRRGHPMQAAGRVALLQMSSGSCRQAWSDGQSPYAACTTGGVMAGLLRLQAGSQVAQGF